MSGVWGFTQGELYERNKRGCTDECFWLCWVRGVPSLDEHLDDLDARSFAWFSRSRCPRADAWGVLLEALFAHWESNANRCDCRWIDEMIIQMIIQMINQLDRDRLSVDFAPRWSMLRSYVFECVRFRASFRPPWPGRCRSSRCRGKTESRP